MKRLWIGLMLFASLVGTAFGSLYTWNPKIRPPVSLEQALRRATELLGDDAANRYCVEVALFGNKEGDGKFGKWNLFFAASDGTQKHVTVDMDGKGELHKPIGPIHRSEKPERRTGVKDVKERLEKLFKNAGIEAEFEFADDELTVSYRTRTYQVYPGAKMAISEKS